MSPSSPRCTICLCPAFRSCRRRRRRPRNHRSCPAGLAYPSDGLAHHGGIAEGRSNGQLAEGEGQAGREGQIVQRGLIHAEVARVVVGGAQTQLPRPADRNSICPATHGASRSCARRRTGRSCLWLGRSRSTTGFGAKGTFTLRPPYASAVG